MAVTHLTLMIIIPIGAGGTAAQHATDEEYRGGPPRALLNQSESWPETPGRS